MPNETPKLSYLTVVITREGVAEMDGASQAVFVPKGEIQRIELMSGTGAERPLVQSVFGAVLVLVGLFSVKTIWLWFKEGGTLFHVQIALVVFMFIGLWMLWEVFRTRIYLFVNTGSDCRKIVFHGKVDSKRLAEFMKAANNDFGYSIQSRLPDVQNP